MASLYEHPRSKFFYIQFRGADGKVHRQSTKIPKGTAQARREAMKIVADLTGKELSRSAHDPRSEWSAWVDRYLHEKYQDSPKTLLRYQECWNSMSRFLKKRELKFPNQIKYQVAPDYMAWRKADGTHHNTARLEVMILGMIMREAVKRGFAQGNPLVKTGITKIKADPKPELTDEDISIIREELKKEPEWMQVSFEIALFTGCRVGETKIALKDIDLGRRLITYAKPKGGAEKAFTARFTSALVPLFEKMKAANQKYTLEFPQESQAYPDVTTNHWFRFFDDLRERGVLSDPDITFHSTRVTFVTRHARARTDERIAKKLVNHGSTLVHQIYSRLRPEDVTDDELEVGLPSSPESS